MSRVDDNHARLLDCAGGWFGRRLCAERIAATRSAWASFARRSAGQPDAGGEFRVRRGKEIEHDAIAEALLGRQDHRLGDRHRLVQIDDEARIAGPEKPVAIGAHRAGPGRPSGPCSRQRTSGMSTTTRFGLASVKTRNCSGSDSSMTKRVRSGCSPTRALRTTGTLGPFGRNRGGIDEIIRDVTWVYGRRRLGACDGRSHRKHKSQRAAPEQHRLSP